MTAAQSSSAMTAAQSSGLPRWTGSSPRRRRPLRSRFHETLNYASVNEDWRTEATALRIGKADHVLCITGSGDRPLDMLALDPARVVAIDRNPAQNRLLALKIAAMRSLEYKDYTAFLGLTHASRHWRAEVWLELQRSLTPDCRTFWRANQGMILAGVIYRGRWERFYRRVATLVRVLRPRMIPRLFEFDDIEKQRAYVRAHWERPAWKAAFHLVCSPITSRLVLGDPAYYAHAQVRLAETMYRRIQASLERHLARENFMVSLVLRGRLPEADLPPYLSPDGYRVIRSRLDRLHIVTGDVIDHMQFAGKGAFTRFSLSDVPSFLSRDGFERLLASVIGCAHRDARVVVRQFLTRYPLPGPFASRLVREPRLEARLEAEDRAFVYEFMVAQVNDA